MGNTALSLEASHLHRNIPTTFLRSYILGAAAIGESMQQLLPPQGSAASDDAMRSIRQSFLFPLSLIRKTQLCFYSFFLSTTSHLTLTDRIQNGSLLAGESRSTVTTLL